jgi:hypothetical protein
MQYTNNNNNYYYYYYYYYSLQVNVCRKMGKPPKELLCQRYKEEKDYFLVLAQLATKIYSQYSDLFLQPNLENNATLNLDDVKDMAPH